MSISSAVQQLSAALASYVTGMIVVKNDSGQFLRYEQEGYRALVFSLFALIASTRIKVEERSISTPS